MAKVLIIGAGMSGLSAAKDLSSRGHEVTVLEASPFVGGRMASQSFGGAVFDHGTPFFTARGLAFEAWTYAASQNGATEQWQHDRGPSDGFVRWRGVPCMNSFAMWLSNDVDIRFSHVVEAVSHHDGEVVCTVRVLKGAQNSPLNPSSPELGLESLQASSSRPGSSSPESTEAQQGYERVDFRAQHIVLTAPVPQSVELIEAGNMSLPKELANKLHARRYSSCITYLCTLQGEHNVDALAAMQLEEDPDSPFSFICDGVVKGTSTIPALCFYLSHNLSVQMHNLDDEQLKSEVLALAKPWLGNAKVLQSRIHRWRFARAMNPARSLAQAFNHGGSKIIFAGDAFGTSNLEGAFNSGLAAAHKVGDLSV